MNRVTSAFVAGSLSNMSVQSNSNGLERFLRSKIEIVIEWAAGKAYYCFPEVLSTMEKPASGLRRE